MRQGALRYRRPDTDAFLATEDCGVPALLQLGTLMNAAEALERDDATSQQLRLLLRAGSSLGGARPKAHVIGTDGRPAIAKFPSPKNDDWDVIRWEYVALELARQAGITTTHHQLERVDGKLRGRRHREPHPTHRQRRAIPPGRRRNRELARSPDCRV